MTRLPYVKLTNRDIGTLLQLVRNEAQAEGYGKLWFADERPLWPKRLKHLGSIARKLRNMRGEYDHTI